jgi:hypothetical protein
MSIRIAQRAAKAQAQAQAKKAEGHKVKGKNVVVPRKKQLVTLFIKNKTDETPESSKDVPEQVIMRDDGTKIGRFRCSRTRVLVLDNNSYMTTAIRCRWTKILKPENPESTTTNSN